MWGVLFVATIVLSEVTDSSWPLFALIALVLGQGIYAFGIVRCPACQGRLSFDRKDIPGTSRYRVRLACRKCDVIWDTGRVSNDEMGS